MCIVMICFGLFILTVSVREVENAPEQSSTTGFNYLVLYLYMHIKFNNRY